MLNRQIHRSYLRFVPFVCEQYPQMKHEGEKGTIIISFLQHPRFCRYEVALSTLSNYIVTY